MKKSKLSLNDLKVKSFVTSLKNHKLQTIKGGLTERECTISNNFSPYLANIDSTVLTRDTNETANPGCVYDT